MAYNIIAENEDYTIVSDYQKIYRKSDKYQSEAQLEKELIKTLTEQQRIVEVLDRFDTLTNDITAGLPAEIEARRKQYEYYRDQLLTFKHKA